VEFLILLSRQVKVTIRVNNRKMDGREKITGLRLSVPLIKTYRSGAGWRIKEYSYTLPFTHGEASIKQPEVKIPKNQKWGGNTPQTKELKVWQRGSRGSKL